MGVSECTQAFIQKAAQASAMSDSKAFWLIRTLCAASYVPCHLCCNGFLCSRRTEIDVALGVNVANSDFNPAINLTES